MSNTTIARPYAKAIFKHALTTNQLQDWSIVLHRLASVLYEPSVKDFINNPEATEEHHGDLLLSAVTDLKNNTVKINEVENLIRLLAHNKRLLLLSDINAQFAALRAEQEKTVTVNVSSFSELTSKQQQQLIQSLSKRLQRQVTLEINIDKTLLGGAIIRADDLVIDGSVRGKLNKLSTTLAA